MRYLALVRLVKCVNEDLLRTFAVGARSPVVGNDMHSSWERFQVVIIERPDWWLDNKILRWNINYPALVDAGEVSLRASAAAQTPDIYLVHFQ